MKLLKDLLRNDRGSQVIEYSLIFMLISIPIVSAAGIATDALQQMFTTLGGMITAAAATL